MNKNITTETKDGMQMTASTNWCVYFSNENEINLEGFGANADKVYVPAKLITRFKRLTDAEKQALTSINEDPDTAKEICLLICKNLADTFAKSQKTNATENEINGWKQLHSTLLQKQVSNCKSTTYLKAINFLQAINVIERYEHYVISEKSMSYRFTVDYFSNKMAIVTLKTEKCISFAKKSLLESIAKAAKCPIERETLRTMALLIHIAAERMLEIGKRKAKKGYINKKGKKLTFMGKNLKSSYKNFNKTRTSVEEGVELYKILFETNGIFLPSSSENAGGRVTTAFNLLPAWIREELVVEGVKERVELDFTCLHPNVANNVYGGTGAHISHDIVVEALYPSSTPKEKSEKRQEVKIEHLSFFNKPLKSGMYDKRFIPGMEDSILFEYYMKNEPTMMANIIKNKEKNGYKSTFKVLAEIETAIMKEVITTINKTNPDCRMIYVYDALEVDAKYADVVRKTMNDVVKKAGINTQAK